MTFVPRNKPNPLFSEIPPKSPLESGYDLLRLFLGLGPLPRTGFPPAPSIERPDLGQFFASPRLGESGPPQEPEDRPLFQGLLNIPDPDPDPDPDSGPRPFPGGNAPVSAPPAFGAWGTAPSFANTPQQFSPCDLRAVTASLSHSALPPLRIAPEPRERDAPPAQSNPYAQGGLGSGAGADWRNEF